MPVETCGRPSVRGRGRGRTPDIRDKQARCHSRTSAPGLARHVAVRTKQVMTRTRRPSVARTAWEAEQRLRRPPNDGGWRVTDGS